ncbi:tannase/feruloyl esterase family alpha/beta hydrolase [Solimonas sp. K1W22B-7]|uniref:tannase/feruloyl esterase family alpha/beta hydrolase n=1 Tax=Solimonas sp. K1W22B-7 TaxID=2303331 RepID=UPI000E333C42|nr:tannase/feruloyl esterase family alpha/beta hydrolase [Solimonas sp. K1W22B-7]AXQ27936.1 tannase/feruloyl esterase family alpha/beta hydrolase [Solimonas sp. K1W22B-7]
MKRPIRLMAGLLSAMLFTGCAHGGEAAVSACDSLGKMQLQNGEVLSVDRVRGGFHLDWRSMLLGIPGFSLPPSCRVELRLRPSPQSNVHALVWMPESGWNGRYQGIGNGGFAGSIDTLSLTVALSRGYAVSATDTGHEANDKDGRWALNNPELIKDYGNRAIHETAVAAKAAIKAYYGRAPNYSYFSSGSNGGRQGLMEAQRHPEDYDGILAGCPAADGTALITNMAWVQQQMLIRNPDGWIPPKKLPAVTAATLAACDAIDGLKDGLIDDPRRCPFQPESLRCKGEDRKDCLSDGQIQTLKAIRSGAGGPSGRLLGYDPGNEDGDMWREWFVGDQPRDSIFYTYALEFNRNLIHSDPAWALENFDVTRDLAVADRGILGQEYNATNPDLSRFVARGGKLIMYHGWNDPALPARKTIQYYESVQGRLGADAVQGFARLYLVPGLEHCFGGPGPNSFGQLPGGGSGEPGSDINAALTDWVEKGIAPGAIVAAKHKGEFKPLLAPPQARPQRTRPLCPYPQVARWTGKGSSDEAANFVCTEAKS